MSTIREIFPRTHWSTYERDGRRRLAIWRQWRRRVWSFTEADLGEG
jgi:hypothetical protein